MISTGITRDLDRNAVVVAFGGEFSVSDRSEVCDVVHKCLAERPLAVVVDLTEVTMLDRRMLPVLLALQYRAMEEPAVGLMVACANIQHRDLLRHSASTRSLPVYDTVTEALAASAIIWSGQRVHLTLDDDTTAARRARRLVDLTCLAWGLPHLVNRARLVIHELVRNAIDHANGATEVSLLLRGHFLYIGVRDNSTDPPLIVEPWHPMAERGRGLRLVADQCTSWGSMTSRSGKLVWATLDLRRGARG